MGVIYNKQLDFCVVPKIVDLTKCMGMHPSKKKL